MDPMWLSTLRAIEDALIEDTLVQRYDVEKTNVNGQPGAQGSFTAYSFWYLECLARAGELERAHLLFEKLLGLAGSRRGSERFLCFYFSALLRGSAPVTFTWFNLGNIHASNAPQEVSPTRCVDRSHITCSVCCAPEPLE